jgi:uncharacterized protein (TIGR02145 family)
MKKGSAFGIGMIVFLLLLIVFVVSCKKKNGNNNNDEPTVKPDSYQVNLVDVNIEEYNEVSSSFILERENMSSFGPMTKSDFSITENGVDISESVIFRDYSSFPLVYKTVILVDVSTDNIANLPDIQYAVKEYINRTYGKEKVSIYTFSGELNQLIDFTSSRSALKAAASMIAPGIGTRNLNGALTAVLPEFSISGVKDVEFGSVLLITSGEDNVNLSSLETVLEKRGDKRIYTYLVDTTASSTTDLEKISNGCFTKVGKILELASSLVSQHELTNTLIRNFYSIQYLSSQLGDKDNEVKITFLNGTSSTNPASCKFTFNSKNFLPLQENKLILDCGTKLYVLPDESKTIEISTLYPLNPPYYTFYSNNPSEISVSEGFTEYEAIIEAKGALADTATITIRDTTNHLELKLSCEIGVTTDVFVDSRDGKSYNIAEYGGKWWFTENLNYETETSCYYDNDEANEVYGRLYTREEASSVCPDGWELPSSYDWERLEGIFDSEYDYGDSEWLPNYWRGFDAGGNMKDNSGQYWGSPNVGAADIYGFRVLPSGIKSTSAFEGLHYNAFFWTDTHSLTSNTARGFKKSSKQILKMNFTDIMYFSIRCIKIE